MVENASVGAALPWQQNERPRRGICRFRLL